MDVFASRDGNDKDDSAFERFLGPDSFPRLDAEDKLAMRRAYIQRDCITALTRNRLGGGGGGVRVGSDHHARFFLNNIRIVTGIDLKLGIPLSTSVLRPPKNQLVNCLENCLVYTDLSDPMACHF